jgi:hypothetical protein
MKRCASGIVVNNAASDEVLIIKPNELGAISEWLNLATFDSR